MSTLPTFSDYIKLQQDFKDVFNLNLDIDTESLWKNRFIFTSDFKHLVDKINPLISKDKGNKKSILLTGTYGVGKSHATGVISHLLWDDIDSIKDNILSRARADMEETGAGLYFFREEGRYFPVLLTAQESNRVKDSDSFEYCLQIGLERALQKYGFFNTTTEKTEFERYANWLKDLVEDSDRQSLKQAFEDKLVTDNDFPNLKILIDALNDREMNALTISHDLFQSLKLQPPHHTNTRVYYQKTLDSLKKQDPKITGIIIYWDEFTTVFNFAGQMNDANLIAVIQDWAEQANNGLVLFLVSHRSPEQLRGLYQILDDSLARIMDRFEEINLKMEQMTTFHLIAESLQVPDQSALSAFFHDHNFGETEFREMMTVCSRIIPDASGRDELVLKKTVPLHIYAAYVATKIADLLGSAERSIFQLIHDKTEQVGPYGIRTGFQRFLISEPQTNNMAWYTIDQVFDYFYSDFEDEIEIKKDRNLAKTIRAFKRDYSLARQIGDDAVKVFKAIILMEMMNAKDGDPYLLPTLQNLTDAFALTDITDLPGILTQLVNKPVLAQPYGDGKNDILIYKTRGGWDSGEFDESKKRLASTLPFEKFIENNKDTILNTIKSVSLGIPRLFHGYISLTAVGEDGLAKMARKPGDKVSTDDINLVIVIPKDTHQFEKLNQMCADLASRSKQTIFLLNEGQHERSYEKWLDALAQEEIGQKRSDGEMLQEADRQRNSVNEKFISDLEWYHLFFRKQHISRSKYQTNDINQCINEIYPLGFDFLTYAEFWKTPKKSQTREIFTHYDKSNGKKDLETSKIFVTKKMIDVFKTEKDDYLVDKCLLLRDDVGPTGLTEIVKKIRHYVEENSGKPIKIRAIIDSLGLEKPPYGLRAWIEAIVIAYALAPFYTEGRLEVQTSNGTPMKDASLITEAIIEAIKKHDAKTCIRYGSIEENRLVKQLNKIFNLGSDTRTLVEAVFKVREIFNTKYGLPLWVVPYGLNKIEQEKLDPFFNLFNDLIVKNQNQNEYNLNDIIELKISIDEVEKTFSLSIWGKIFTPLAFKNGFSAYVKNRYPALLSYHPSMEDLLERIKADIPEDVWMWTDTRVTDVLAKLSRSTQPPSKPNNPKVSMESDGEIVLVWDPPTAEDNQPDHYEIHCGIEPTNLLYLGRTRSTETRYVDIKHEYGKTYYYTIISRNTADKSEPSDLISIHILPPLPQIPLTVTPAEEQVTLSWNLPGAEYAIQSFELFRGTAPHDLTPIISIGGENEVFQDFNVQSGAKYIYGLRAINSAGNISPVSRSLRVAIPSHEPPATPEHLRLECPGEWIRLIWGVPETGIESVRTYNILREDPSGLILPIMTLGPEQCVFDDKEIEIGKNYLYQVIAENAYGESPAAISGPIRILLQLPPLDMNLTEENGKVTLRWNSLSPEYGVTEYEISRGTNGNQMEFLAKIQVGSTEYLDQTVKAGRHYRYDLIVRNEKGDRRQLDEPRSISIAAKVDVNAWEEATRSFVGTEPHTFLAALKNVIRTIGNNPSDDTTHILEKICAVLEEMPDE